MKSIDLNADVGEVDIDLDARIIEVVSSVSIACGGHAGDDASMRAVATFAAARGVRIGAHPSYEDRAGFGRTRHHLPRAELTAQLRAQIARLVANSPAGVAYVKPHGALYHAAAEDHTVAAALVDAADGLPLMGQRGARYLKYADRAIHEGFADRAYNDDGRLLPRSEPGAVLDEAGALQQVATLATGRVRTASGREIPVHVETICLHSDTPGAADLARSVATHLIAKGIVVRAEP
jgi:UPF0271 protein